MILPLDKPRKRTKPFDSTRPIALTRAKKRRFSLSQGLSQVLYSASAGGLQGPPPPLPYGGRDLSDSTDHGGHKVRTNSMETFSSRRRQRAFQIFAVVDRDSTKICTGAELLPTFPSTICSHPTVYKEANRSFRFGRDETAFATTGSDYAPRHRPAPAPPAKKVDLSAPNPAWVDRLCVHNPRPVRPFCVRRALHQRLQHGAPSGPSDD